MYQDQAQDEELRADDTATGLVHDSQDIDDDENESLEPLGILDEDINNQIELLDQLQQLNSLDQSMLNEEQVQQFNELVQIKKDLEKSIRDKERKQFTYNDRRVEKDSDLNST